ncbi:MAG: hypothetical protein FJY66_00420 [Calditrichaeota bacterium]|nr:hypothetical protein [Calditrichota bacterium]
MKFLHDNWTFNYTDGGVGPTVVFLSRTPLGEEATALAEALRRDFFVICLQTSGTDTSKFPKAIEAFFTDRQLWRVHWVVANDAEDLANSLLKHLPRAVWSMSIENTTRVEATIKAISRLAPEAESILREEFARVDPPYRTSEHPI